VVTGGDRTLTLWAAACAEHAVAGFDAWPEDDPARRAIATARAWADGTGTTQECRDAAFDAQRFARDAHDVGHRALATAIRAASTAAASVDDPQLALVAAGYAVEAVEANSAACELASRTGGERQWQWEQLPEDRRREGLGERPPTPPAAACAVEFGGP
jgi:hypothetical protein